MRTFISFIASEIYNVKLGYLKQLEYASRSRKYFNDMCIHIAYVFLKHRYKFECSRRDMKILINHEITFNFRDYIQHSVLIIRFFFIYGRA